MSQVPEKFYCFKRNTNISTLSQFDHTGRTGHRSNALFKYEKVGEMKSTEVSDILAPKCSPTSNVSLRKEVLEVGTSASSCEFMSCPYFNNCTISINVNGVGKNE